MMAKTTYRSWSDLKKRVRSPERLAELHREAVAELMELDLRAIRELAGKTPGEVARVMKTAQSEISRMEAREVPQAVHVA